MKTELVADIIKLRPAALLTVALTIAMYLVLLVLLPKIGVRGEKRCFLLGFVGLSGRSLAHLSVSWVRFAFYVSVLVTFSSIGRIQFFALGLLTLIILVLNNSLSGFISEIVGSCILAAGLFVMSYLADYLNLIRSGFDTQIAYRLLSVFLIICAAIILIREYIFISGERTYFNEAGELE